MTEATQTSAHEPAVPVKRLTVMIVDDEHDMRSLVANVLTEYGYKTVTSSSAAKALALLDKMSSPPDLLLTDVVMPGMSGPMLADELLSRFGSARVLFMSGYVERQVVQRYVVEKGFPLITIAQSHLNVRVPHIGRHISGRDVDGAETGVIHLKPNQFR